MGGDWKELQADGLGQIQRGITDALDELKEVGSIGRAGAGRGFEEIALSGMQLGHGGLTEAFGDFCERWEWGVRALIVEGNDFAEGVGLAAGTYHENEQYIKGTLKIGANALQGNPHLSEEEVTSQSWDEVWDNGSGSDYSLESFEEAGANASQGWKDAGRDAATSPLIAPGMAESRERAGITDEQYERSLDEQFGPSPEERAKAAERQAIEDGAQGGAQG